MRAVSGQLNISKQKDKAHRVPAAVEFININSLNCNLRRVNDHSVSAKNRWPNRVAPAKKRRVSQQTLDKSRLWRDGAFGAH